MSVSVQVYNLRQTGLAMQQQATIASGGNKTRSYKDVNLDDIEGEFTSLTARGVVVLKDGTAVSGSKVSTDGANFAITTEQAVIVDTDADGVTVTLPAVAGKAVGHRIWIMLRTKGAGNLTVDGNGAETVLGAATQVLSAAGAILRIENDGTAWIAPTSLA
jgi:hypothetical protein